MTTIKFDKSVEEIEQPVPIPSDYYLCRVVKEPEVNPNKKKKAGKTYEDGAGDNLEISLVVEDDRPEISGRRFTLYFPVPQKEDMENYDGRGMLQYDAKMSRISNFASVATGCSILDDEITILPNATVGVYIDRGLDSRDGVTLVNNINTFSETTFISPDRISELSVDTGSDDGTAF